MIRPLVILAALASVAHAGPGKKSAPPAPPVPAQPPAPPEPPPAPLPPASDPRMIIAVLDVRIDGAPPDVGSQFQKILDEQVDPKHFFVSPHSQIRDIMAGSTRWTDGCDVGPCMQELRKQTRAQLALLASLSGSGTSFGWVITLVRTDSGNVLSQRAERCDVCTVDEALRNATRAAIDLLSAVPSTLPDEHPAAPPPAPDVSPKLAAMQHGKRVSGVAMLVAGVVAAAAGTAVYYAENHSSAGIGVGGLGAGLIVGSIMTFTF